MDSPARHTQHERISGDLLCVFCGYNLRTLAATGICPECGRAVSETLHNQLTAADLAWLKLTRGDVDLLIWSPIVAIGCVVVTYAVEGSSRTVGLFALSCLGVGCIAGLAYVLGVCQFLIRDPRGLIVGSPRLRWTPVVCLVLILMIAVAGSPYVTLGSTELLPGLCALALPLFSILVVARARALGKVVHRPGVVRFASVTMSVGGMTLALVLLLLMFQNTRRIGPLVGSNAARMIETALHRYAVPMTVATLVVLNVALMIRLRREVTRAIRTAQSREISMTDAVTPGELADQETREVLDP